MKMRIQNCRAAVLCTLLAMSTAMAAPAPGDHPGIEALVKTDAFEDIKISPDGSYFAATVPMGDRTALAILRRSDGAITGSANLGQNRHVADFWWVNDGRVLFSLAQKFGSLDEPQLTGDIFATDAADGSTDILVGQHVDVMSTGSNIKSKRTERVAAFLIDTLQDDEDHVLIAVSPFSSDPFSRIEKMHVKSGRRVQIARAPVRNARFFSDNNSVVRVAYGVDLDNDVQTYLRDGNDSEWRLINAQATTGRIELPIGFSADNKLLYLRSERAAGPDAIVAMDVTTGVRTQVLADDDTDPSQVIYSERRVPAGVRFMDGKPRTEFFDPASAEARQYRSLEAAFPGQAPWITSKTRDGRYSLVSVTSDRNPGDFFLFDAEAKKADHVISRRDWVDPETMGERRPVSLKARDGLVLKGYVTLPNGVEAKALPLVVMPHGGPYGVYDSWEFDPEAQLLASAGYAVLQVNFRGSGNHGLAFQEAGAREWGGKMQDDLTDATRWAIAEGIADSRRICIYGASYGGYAALMGVAKDASLYRCAAGYVGVYDLPTMQAETARTSRRLGSWSTDWVGSDAQALAAASPNRLADRIKVPVFLAAGGEDEIAPIGHSEKMEKALRAVGVPVETLYFQTEGHGFYVEDNRKEFYRRLLAFLDRNIGAGAADSTAALGR